VPAVLLLGYVVGLTHVARFENASAIGRTWPMLLLFAPAAYSLFEEMRARTAIEHPFETSLLYAGVVVGIGVGWTFRAIRTALRGGKAIGSAVVALIAGISLVDAVFLAFLRPEAVGALVFALAAFVMTLVFQRWVRGT
jgi:4-hydroxybenzoate polyprenyltransferase